MQQISNNNIKRIRSLQLKKYRDLHHQFVVEGPKVVDEAIEACPNDIEMLVYSDEHAHFNLPENRCYYLPPAQLTKLGNQASGTKILAVIRKKTHILPEKLNGWVLALDGIQDPGNLGTIVRTADWFGIKDIVCSEDTVDVFNPKCLQASMGSVFRVNVHYTQLENWIKPISDMAYAAVLDGTDLSKMEKRENGVIVLGNEGQGIRASLQEILPHKIRIAGHSECESLNVGVSAGILLHHFCV